VANAHSPLAAALKLAALTETREIKTTSTIVKGPTASKLFTETAALAWKRIPQKAAELMVSQLISPCSLAVVLSLGSAQLAGARLVASRSHMNAFNSREKGTSSRSAWNV